MVSYKNTSKKQKQTYNKNLQKYPFCVTVQSIPKDVKQKNYFIDII